MERRPDSSEVQNTPPRGNPEVIIVEAPKKIKIIDLGPYKVGPPTLSDIWNHIPINFYRVSDIIQCLGCYQEKPDSPGRRGTGSQIDSNSFQTDMFQHSIEDAKKTGSGLHLFVSFTHDKEKVEKAGFDPEKIINDPKYTMDILKNYWPEYLDTVDPDTGKREDPQLSQHLKKLRTLNKFDEQITAPLEKYLAIQQVLGSELVDSEGKFGFLLYSKTKYTVFRSKFDEKKKHPVTKKMTDDNIGIYGKFDQVRFDGKKVQIWELKKNVAYTDTQHAIQLGIQQLAFQYYARETGLDKKLNLKTDSKYGNFYLPELILYGFSKGDQFRLNITDFAKFDRSLRKILFLTQLLRLSRYREYREGHIHNKGIIEKDSAPNVHDIRIGQDWHKPSTLYKRLDEVVAAFDSTYHFEALTEESQSSGGDEVLDLIGGEQPDLTPTENVVFIPKKNKITIPGKEDEVVDLRRIIPPASERDFIWVPRYDDPKPFQKKDMVQKRILKSKGLSTDSEVEEFLHPSLKDITIESLGIDKKEIEKARVLINEVIDNEGLILVHGDWDVDGICSAVLMVETLEKMGANVIPYFPPRSTGYGLTPEGIENMPVKPNLIIMTDNGIRATDGVREAAFEDIRTIVVDHHPMPFDKKYFSYPDATIHTQETSATGVAYFFSQELYFDFSPKERQKRVELAALATIADDISQIKKGVNRAFAKLGADSMLNTQIKGLQSLMEQTKVGSGNKAEDEFDMFRFHSPSDLNFKIIPRLNAAGKVDNAMLSYRLLTTSDQFEAYNLAKELIDIHKKQRQIIDQIVLDARGEIDRTGGQKDKLVFITGEETTQWTKALNIDVARRLRTDYGLPAVVLTRNGDLYTGAVDSIPDFFMKFALQQIQKYTSDPDAEPQFRNIQIPEKNIEVVQKILTNLANARINDEMLYVKMPYDLVLSLRNTSKEMKDAVVELGPFGKDNYSPNFATFAAKMIVEEYFGDYEQHVQLQLINQHSRPNRVYAFNMRRRIQELHEMGCQVDALFKLVDDWEDKSHASLSLVTIRPAEKENNDHDKEDINPAFKYWERTPELRFPLQNGHGE